MITNKRVLVLDCNYQPLQFSNIKRIINLLLNSKVDVIHEYDDIEIRAMSLSIKAPSVVRLKKYINRKYPEVTLSKRNIHIRDRYICQYCGSKIKELTVDHIVPKIKGGSFTWENLVSCCKKCNNKKDSKTLEESGMILLKKPKKPTHYLFLKAMEFELTIWGDYFPRDQ